MDRSARTRRTVGLVAAAALTTLALAPSGAAAAVAAKPPSAKVCDTRANVSYKNLLECVRLDGVLEHEKAL